MLSTLINLNDLICFKTHQTSFPQEKKKEKKKKAEWFRTEPPYSSWEHLNKICSTGTSEHELLSYVKYLYTWLYLPSLRPLVQSESRKNTCFSFGHKIWKWLLKTQNTEINLTCIKMSWWLTQSIQCDMLHDGKIMQSFAEASTYHK